MRIPNAWLMLALAVSFGLGAVGCSPEAMVEKSQPVEMEGPPPDIEDAHAHHDEGPNGGHLIELGRSHEYHAEIVEDKETGVISVHILGQKLQPWPIKQPTILLSLLVNGVPQMFELRTQDSVDGKASSFQSTDPVLHETLHQPGASGKLLVMIDEKSYSGVVELHDHDH